MLNFFTYLNDLCTNYLAFSYNNSQDISELIGLDFDVHIGRGGSVYLETTEGDEHHLSRLGKQSIAKLMLYELELDNEWAMYCWVIEHRFSDIEGAIRELLIEYIKADKTLGEIFDEIKRDWSFTDDELALYNKDRLADLKEFNERNYD